MFKIKKFSLVVITIIYVILTIIELIEYLCIDSNLFGLVYLFISIIIIFLLVPVAYNYKRHYSKERISKLIIIVVFGVINSFIINSILLNSMNYSDASREIINNIFVIKNILKPIVYGSLLIFTVIESNIIGIIMSKTGKH